MSWQQSAWELETARLRVVGWRRRGDDALVSFLCSTLTDEVTRELPPSWQAGVSPATAGRWIAAREAEGAMFLVEEKGSGAPVGFFMFFAGDATRTSGEVRIGYVFARDAWGRGYATELVRGFVRRWDDAGVTAVLLAGVSEANLASQRVLEKAGFVRVGRAGEVLDYERRG